MLVFRFNSSGLDDEFHAAGAVGVRAVEGSVSFIGVSDCFEAVEEILQIHEIGRAHV